VTTATAPTPPGGKRSTSKRATLTRLWGIRLGIVLAAGLIAGATAGVVGVNTLEPGRASEPDSLQVLLDSISKGMTAPASRARASTAPSEPVAPNVGNPPPDTVAANPDEISVPDLVGSEEGTARTTLTTAGLNIGTIEFRSSASPAGTVLATIPVFNAKVKRGTPVALVLSDGRAPGDTLSNSLHSPEALR
jgi:hypothetical protein